ncbi:hypothetical protein T09_3242 [Trichinella sp. T9]|nr:hypothetical protein T09_3242 [Trichinella sp. T9]
MKSEMQVILLIRLRQIYKNDATSSSSSSSSSLGDAFEYDAAEDVYSSAGVRSSKSSSCC